MNKNWFLSLLVTLAVASFLKFKKNQQLKNYKKE